MLKFFLYFEILRFRIQPARSCLLAIKALSVANYTAVTNRQHQRNRALAGGDSIFSCKHSVPFDKLTALSEVEGLCAVRYALYP